MAAPVATAAGTPTGIKLDDGFSSKIVLAHKPNISLWIKTVKPPGGDGGDAIDTTTMHNLAWRTMSSRALITLTTSTAKCAYDPLVYNDILEELNREQTITQIFSDTSTLAYYGFLQKFEPDDLVEGQQAEATITVTPTNFDPTNHVESGPTLVSAAGT